MIQVKIKGKKSYLIGLADNPPHPMSSPILISQDHDLGWIVQSVNDGEYEIAEFPSPDEKHKDIDFGLAQEISNGREIWLFV